MVPKLTSCHMDQTCVYIPSYFDFVRIRNHLKKEEVEFVAMSELVALKIYIPHPLASPPPLLSPSLFPSPLPLSSPQVHKALLIVQGSLFLLQGPQEALTNNRTTPFLPQIQTNWHMPSCILWVAHLP